ncbi:MAG: PD-(D/E)XK nuclease family protein [Euryarchaeota archaeon]|nr:PD-(D/E)XK nuclease family protein [Euryarchaeota archaeon]
MKQRGRCAAVVSDLAGEDEWKGVDIERVKPMLDVFWKRNREHMRSNLIVERKFTVPLGGHLFKGFIDRVDLIPGTDSKVEITDYKTGGEPGPGKRSRQLLLYAQGFSHLHPGYTVRRPSPGTAVEAKTADV